MASSLDYAKEWMRDGDRPPRGAGHRLISAAGDGHPIDIEMASRTSRGQLRCT